MCYTSSTRAEPTVQLLLCLRLGSVSPETVSVEFPATFRGVRVPVSSCRAPLSGAGSCLLNTPSLFGVRRGFKGTSALGHGHSWSWSESGPSRGCKKHKFIFMQCTASGPHTTPHRGQRWLQGSHSLRLLQLHHRSLHPSVSISHLAFGRHSVTLAELCRLHFLIVAVIYRSRRAVARRFKTTDCFFFLNVFKRRQCA